MELMDYELEIIRNRNMKMDRKPGKLRSTFSQVLACTAPNLLLTDLGLALSFATLIIPAVLNAKEGISLTDNEASWLGSIIFLFPPIGSLMAASIMDRLGRKPALFIVNIPHLVAFLIIHFAQDKSAIFVASVLFGLGTGIMQPPSITYAGEISLPSVRGILTSLSLVFSDFGTVVCYFLGSIVDWRTAAAICLLIPIASMITVFPIPDTPVWLISKGRHNDAIKSLCWLRGWCKPQFIQDEYRSLLRYNELSNQCFKCVAMNSGEQTDMTLCSHRSATFPGNISKTVQLLAGKETMRPLKIVVSCFVLCSLTGLTAIRPNLVNVCRAFGMNADQNWIINAVGLLIISGGIFCSVIIKFTGKRKLMLFSIFGTSILNFLMGLYAYQSLPHTINSYDESTFPKEYSNLPVIYLCSLVFISSMGLNQLPWIFESELLPFKSRSTVCGLGGAIFYFFVFVSTKSFIDVEKGLGMFGAFWIYATIGFLGTIYLYYYLPETENKSLEEIEKEFSGEKEKIQADDFLTALLTRRNQNADEF